MCGTPGQTNSLVSISLISLASAAEKLHLTSWSVNLARFGGDKAKTPPQSIT